MSSSGNIYMCTRVDDVFASCQGRSLIQVKIRTPLSAYSTMDYFSLYGSVDLVRFAHERSRIRSPAHQHNLRHFANVWQKKIDQVAVVTYQIFVVTIFEILSITAGLATLLSPIL